MADTGPLDKLLPALLKAQGQFQHAPKSSVNPHFKNTYADLTTVIDTVKPALQANDLVVSHRREVVDLQEYLITTLYHVSGQCLQSRTLLQPAKKDPQGYGSAITYARRYDLAALLGLAQDDDDANEASKNCTQQRQQNKPSNGNTSKSSEILSGFLGRLTTCKTKNDLDEFGQQITDEVKQALTSEDLATLRRNYSGKIAEFNSAVA